MANHKSSAKRAKQSIKRTLRNANIDSKTKTIVRNFRETVANGDKDNLEAAFKSAAKVLRQAASKGIMTKQTVSRRVSRLTLAYNQAQKA